MRRLTGRPNREPADRRVWLEFQLPRDAEALYYAQRGEEFRDVLSAVRDLLRSRRKYGLTGHDVDEVWDALWEDLSDRSLKLDYE